MKLKYLLGVLPMALSAAKLSSGNAERKVASSYSMNEISSAGINSVRQECRQKTNEDVEECLTPFFDAFTEAGSELSRSQQVTIALSLAVLTFTGDLEAEAVSEVLDAIAGESFFCTEEFVDTLPLLTFCAMECDSGFCDANQEDLAVSLQTAFTVFNCEKEVEDVCEVFYDVPGAEERPVVVVEPGAGYVPTGFLGSVGALVVSFQVIGFTKYW
eukprot:snap_masked-scaffold_56-processed-gene-1.39-mRNA-1 protein AED:1.00 eAED:1.00 QI:0/0/0/0/1/1/2/0/214